SSGVPGGHQDGVTALAFSPDGRRLLSAGGEPAEGEGHARDYALRLWALPRDLPSEGATLSVARELRAWLGPALPTVLLPPAGARAGPGTTVPVAPLAASADGKVLLSAGADHQVRVWDLQTGRERGRLVGSPSAVSAVAVTPDGTTAVTG